MLEYRDTRGTGDQRIRRHLKRKGQEARDK